MKYSHLFIAISIAVSGVLLAGCDKKNDEAAAAAAQQMPPATVNVMPVQFQTVPMVQEFSGRTAPYQQADVRPQVTGVIDEILYREGGMVQKGQPLYKLSIENYQSTQAASQAAVQQAAANVNTAKASYNNALASRAAQEAELQQARVDMQRLEPLVGMKAISQQQYDQAVTRYKTAQAAYASAQAAIEQAKANIASSEAAVNTAKAQLSGSQLNLNRTIVRAPISGKTDRSNVTAGALVNANQAQPLVTISKLDPIYVDISQSSSDLLKLKRQQASGAIQPGSSTVELVLEDGTTYPVRGQLSLAEAKVDEGTGAVTLRAIFKNDSYMLLPGMYVKARIVQGLLNNAVLLPQSAIMRSPKGETQVYIVDNNDKIQIRTVNVEGTYKGDWIITDGLNAGENVVIIGGSKVKPEQEVVSKPLPNATKQKASVPQQSGAPKGPFAPKAQDNEKKTPETDAAQ